MNDGFALVVVGSLIVGALMWLSIPSHPSADAYNYVTVDSNTEKATMSRLLHDGWHIIFETETGVVTFRKLKE